MPPSELKRHWEAASTLDPGVWRQVVVATGSMVGAAASVSLATSERSCSARALIPVSIPVSM